MLGQPLASMGLKRLAEASGGAFSALNSYSSCVLREKQIPCSLLWLGLIRWCKMRDGDGKPSNWKTGVVFKHWRARLQAVFCQLTV